MKPFRCRELDTGKPNQIEYKVLNMVIQTEELASTMEANEMISKTLCSTNKRSNIEHVGNIATQLKL